jgi:hypothetical protein
MQAIRFTVAAIAALGIATGAGVVHAQGNSKEREAAVKVLIENDKVRVTESISKPGDVSHGPRPARVNYYLTSGTFERTSPDGKKTKVERQAGTATFLEPDSGDVVVKNVGKTTIKLISVVHK